VQYFITIRTTARNIELASNIATMGLMSQLRPKKYRSYKGTAGRIALNLLARQCQASTANHKWVTDVTQFNVAVETLYLSPVMDLTMARSFPLRQRAERCLDRSSKILPKALPRLKCREQPILHSDQGWHYQMPAYQYHLSRRGITQSMSRKGNCLDNASMESCFATHKCELFRLGQINTVDDLQAGIA
jgi:putative transposase